MRQTKADKAAAVKRDQPTGGSNAAMPVKSAVRVLDILEAVAAGHASFSQLMQALGIPRSSLFHLLGTLMARGYLEQDAASAAYRLGPGLAQLARQRPAPGLLERVRPVLQRLSAEINETTGFYVREGDHVVAIATHTGGQALTYTMRVSEKAPLYAVSSGKIVLSLMDDAEIRAYLARTRFESFTPHTLSSSKPLWEEIRIARRDGFAYAREEFTIGIIGIAIAVRAPEGLLGMLNLAVPSARFTRANAALFRQKLRQAAAELAAA